MSASTAPGACWGCGVCPDAGKSFQFCSKCRDLKLAPSFFCGKDCLTKNWPRHKAWHLVQSDLSAKRANVNALSQAVTAQQQRTLNDAKLAALSQVTNPELRQRIADAKAAVDGSKRPAGKAPVKAPVVDPFVAELAEAEKFRQARELDKALACLKRAALHRPDDPRPPFQMCMLQTAMGDVVGACDSALRCVHIAPGGHLGVLPSELTKLGGPKVPRGVYPQIGLRAAVMAFDLLIRPPCDGVAGAPLPLPRLQCGALPHPGPAGAAATRLAPTWRRRVLPAMRLVRLGLRPAQPDAVQPGLAPPLRANRECAVNMRA